MHQNHLFNINITTVTTTKPRISETMELMSKFTDLHQLTRVFFHNHGEELRLLIHQMDSRTHLSNGSINQQLHLYNTNIITSTIIKPRILGITESMSKFTDLLLQTRVFFHNHGEEQRKHTQRMDSRTHLGNGLHDLRII